MLRLVTAQECLGVRSQVLRPNWELVDCLLPADSEPHSFHLAYEAGTKIVGVASFFSQQLPGQHGRGYRLRQMGCCPIIADKASARPFLRVVCTNFDRCR